ncbi:hypothetical protein, partial [Hydrogenimonas sp.]
MRGYLWIFALIVAGLAFTGCAGGGPTVDYDPHAKPTAYRTFSVARSENAAIDPLNAERIEHAIVRNLTARG